MSQTIQPIIGVTSTVTKNKAGSPVCSVGQAYINAIRKAGSLPLLIPVGIELSGLDAFVQHLDGVLFTGGGDIDLQFFEGQNHPKISNVIIERDRLEFKLFDLSRKADLPLLAICRGIQVMNVALGGTLHTHIQNQLLGAMKHDYYPDFPRDKIAHKIKVTPGSRLHQILGETEVPVNSLHHQGIAKIGKGLEAVATAPDGLVEAVEIQDARFALGVQWHPECLPESVPMQKLFTAFVDACKE